MLLQYTTLKWEAIRAAERLGKPDLLGNFVKWAFLAILALAVIIPIYMRFFYKGRDRVIEVVKRRRTVRDFFYPRLNASNHSSYIEMENYSIDVRYENSRHIHTLFCSKEIYKHLTAGKKYSVHIHIHEVTKIHRGK